jgi:hypothetical protein
VHIPSLLFWHRKGFFETSCAPGDTPMTAIAYLRIDTIDHTKEFEHTIDRLSPSGAFKKSFVSKYNIYYLSMEEKNILDRLIPDYSQRLEH